MINRPKISDADEFIVATEVGILHRLRRENPTKTFFPGKRAGGVRIHEGDDAAEGFELACRSSSITSPSIPRDRGHARGLAIERMIAIGGQTAAVAEA